MARLRGENRTGPPNFLTSPFGDIREMQRSVAKNAYSCNGPATAPAHGPAKILVEILGRPTTVMQKPRVQEEKCITQRDANIGAPSTAASPLKEISLGPLFSMPSPGRPFRRFRLGRRERQTASLTPSECCPGLNDRGPGPEPICDGGPAYGVTPPVPATRTASRPAVA
jgi:hypothetical protein